ncbi:MAG: CehA/McbA family metallohydrolase [Gemmatimonadales bacterium]
MPVALRAAGLVAAAAVLALPAAAQRETVLKQIAVPHTYYFREMYLPQLTSGPGWVTWSPDGTTLIYAMAGSLWRQALGSTEATQLTDGPGYDAQPDWSPDGRSVVYSSYRDDAVELRLLDLASGTDASLLANGGVNVEPRWSPDGRRIAFVSTAFQGRWHVFTAEVAGGRLTGEPGMITTDHDSQLPRYYYGKYDHFISPTWSPDGRELILISNAGRIWGTGGFWRIDARPGAVPKQIWYEETTWKARPDWAKDGKRVVYSSYLGRQWNQLFLMTSEGGDPFQLTYGEFDHTNPRWSPNGDRIAFISNAGGNTSLRVLDVPGGAPKTIRAATLRYRTPRTAVTIRVTDRAGRATPARVSVTGESGRGFVPRDAWAHADDGFDRRDRKFEVTYWHTGGVNQLTLAPGRYVVEVTKGLEYDREVDTIVVGARALTHRVTLQRLMDLPARGWWSGDLHVHMNYGGHYRNTPERLRFQAEAEDLHLVENLIVNKEARIPDMAYFAGPLDRASTATTLIKHDEEYHTSYWGHSAQIGLNEFLLPNYAGYVNTGAASLYPHNTKIFELTRAQGGLTGYVHPFEAVPDFAKGEILNHAFPVDAALGRLDYIEVVGFSDHLATAAIWYKLLNTGLRLPTGAGTDAMANYASLRGHVGMGRVFVKSGRLDYRTWLAALKAGRTFATNGPLLTFSIDGAEPGDEIARPGRATLIARLSLRSIVPVDSLEIVANGRVIHSVPLTGDRRRADATVPIEATASGWYTLRAFSRQSRHPVLDIYPFATTSPIYLTIAGAPIRSAEDARFFIAWLDGMERGAVAHPGWNSAAEKDRVLGDIRQAREFFEGAGRKAQGAGRPR